MIKRVKACLAVAVLSLMLLGFAGAQSFAMPEVKRIVLPNRLVVLVLEEHSLPFVTVQLLVDAGSWRDPAGKQGIANLTAKSLLLGAAGLSEDQINAQLDFMGARLTTSCGRDYATIDLKILSKDMKQGFGLLARIVTEPTFPGQEVRRERNKVLGSIEAEEDQPGEVAEKAFRKALFTASPYAHPVQGTKESLSAVASEDVAEFHRRFYRPNHSILTVVGDISPEELQQSLFQKLAEWPQMDLPPVSFPEDFAEGPETIKIDRNISQANIIIGHKGVARSNKDYYALSVMNYILGGGLGSRLANEIRIKRGLAYSVGCQFVPYKHPGSFQIVLQTKNASAREAIALSIEQMRNIKTGPVSEQELETAKKYLIGSFPLRFTTQAGLAGFFSQVEYYRLGLDYPARYPSLIEAVTRQDVQRVAQAYLHPDHTLQAIVADLKETGLNGSDH